MCVPELRGQRVAYFLAVHAVREMSRDVVDRGGHIAAVAFNKDIMPFYRALGFETMDDPAAMHRVQLVGTGTAATASASGARVADSHGVADVPHVGLNRSLSADALWMHAEAVHDHPGLQLFSAAVRNDWSAIVDYDAAVFPARREPFLHMWLANAHAAVVSRAPQGDHLRGFGCVRKVDIGFRVGPLFADDADTATTLLAALLARVPAGEVVTVDMPDRHTGAALRLGGVIVSEYDFILAGARPPPSFRRVYGVTTTEAG